MCYRNRKDNGLCARCGKPLGREGHYCSECLRKINEYHRQNKRFYRKHHVCTECGKILVLGNDKICPECRAKMEGRRKQLPDEQKQLYGETFKKRQKSLYMDREQKKNLHKMWQKEGFARESKMWNMPC